MNELAASTMKKDNKDCSISLLALRTFRGMLTDSPNKNYHDNSNRVLLAMKTVLTLVFSTNMRRLTLYLFEAYF